MATQKIGNYDPYKALDLSDLHLDARGFTCIGCALTRLDMRCQKPTRQPNIEEACRILNIMTVPPTSPRQVLERFASLLLCTTHQYQL